MHDGSYFAKSEKLHFILGTRWKKKLITPKPLPTKMWAVQATVFPVTRHWSESWILKKQDTKSTDSPHLMTIYLATVRSYDAIENWLKVSPCTYDGVPAVMCNYNFGAWQSACIYNSYSFLGSCGHYLWFSQLGSNKQN